MLLWSQLHILSLLKGRKSFFYKPSSWNCIIANYRTFRKPDVPSHVTKFAPDFCSVYVIAKAKVLSVRSAQRPVANTPTPPKLSCSLGLTHQLSGEHGLMEDTRSVECAAITSYAWKTNFFAVTSLHFFFCLQEIVFVSSKFAILGSESKWWRKGKYCFTPRLMMCRL